MIQRVGSRRPGWKGGEKSEVAYGTGEFESLANGLTLRAKLGSSHERGGGERDGE
jgi:hypothetical protein